MCLTEWPWPRIVCPGFGEDMTSKSLYQNPNGLLVRAGLFPWTRAFDSSNQLTIMWSYL